MRPPFRAGVVTRRLAAAGVVLGTMGLFGCSTVPNVGPSRESVLATSTAPDQPYLLVPINDYTTQQLAKFPGPSLFGKFGDYRGAVEQRIGVGDTVEISIFEAAAGGLFSQPVMSANTTGSHSATIPPQIVQQDGTITVPYAGQINVVGKTTPEVEKIIVEAHRTREARLFPGPPAGSFQIPCDACHGCKVGLGWSFVNCLLTSKKLHGPILAWGITNIEVCASMSFLAVHLTSFRLTLQGWSSCASGSGLDCLSRTTDLFLSKNIQCLLARCMPR